MPGESDRIETLLRQPSESLNVELKTWIDPETPTGTATLVKAIFALRNRNGGYLLVGFDNKTLQPDAYPYAEPIEIKFHQDVIQGIVSRYSAPPFGIDIRFTSAGGQSNAVIVIPEGVRTPAVVTRDLVGAGQEKLLRVGDIYFRTLNSNGTPSSARILPRDWPELLDILFENREADIGRFLRRHLGGSDLSSLFAGLSTSLQPSLAPVEYLRSRAIKIIEDGEGRFEEAAAHSLLLSENTLPPKALTMSVGLALDPPHPSELPTKEFMNRVASANPNYTGWPVWLDSRSFHEPEHRAYVDNNGWQALIVDLGDSWSRHLEFMRLDPRGEFLLRRVMQDDLTKKVEPGSALDPKLMIYRVTEVLAAGISIARAVGWGENDLAGFAFRWTGLAGRELRPWANGFSMTEGARGRSRAETASSFVSIPLDTPHSALAPHVADATAPLFAQFEGWQPSQRLIEDSVREMVERRMP